MAAPVSFKSQFGWKKKRTKTRMGFRRQETPKSSQARIGSDMQTPPIRNFHAMPARNSIIAVTPAMTSAVPRSGSRTIRATNTSGMMLARQRVLHLLILSSRVEKNQARKRTSMSLASSDGWKENPPKRIQRRALFDLGKKKTIASKMVVREKAGKMKRGDL